MAFSKFSWYRGSVLLIYTIVRWTKCKLTLICTDKKCIEHVFWNPATEAKTQLHPKLGKDVVYSVIYCESTMVILLLSMWLKIWLHLSAYGYGWKCWKLQKFNWLYSQEVWNVCTPLCPKYAINAWSVSSVTCYSDPLW